MFSIKQHLKLFYYVLPGMIRQQMSPVVQILNNSFFENFIMEFVVKVSYIYMQYEKYYYLFYAQGEIDNLQA